MTRRSARLYGGDLDGGADCGTRQRSGLRRSMTRCDARWPSPARRWFWATQGRELPFKIFEPYGAMGR
jgi:hypothetical protein